MNENEIKKNFSHLKIWKPDWMFKLDETRMKQEKKRLQGSNDSNHCFEQFESFEYFYCSIFMIFSFNSSDT